MTMTLVLLMLLGSAIGGAFLGRQILRRARRIRRLERAEAETAAAIEDGRLPRETGEAMLQHLEGLRRECSAGDEV